jgi:hypothetical protein
MSRIRLYVDEDAMQHSLVVALRARHVDVVTATGCEMINRSDQAHLRWASDNGCALYSFNIRDYSALHQEWIARGESHCGIILASQRRYSTGEQLRRPLRLMNRKAAGEMLSRLEYLSNWES